jgi:hypothetical protein
MGATVVTKAGSDAFTLNSIAEVFDNAAPNNIINAAGIQAVAPTTNAHLLLLPKGAGGISCIFPSTLFPLGDQALNLGLIYGSSASGAKSLNFANGGTASGGNAINFGFGGTASGQGAINFAAGFSMGTSTVNFGVLTNQGSYSAAFGGGFATQIGQNKLSVQSLGDQFGTSGLAAGITPISVTADDTGPAILSANGIYDIGAYDNSTTFCLLNLSSAVFEIFVIAKSSVGTAAAWRVTGLFSVDTTGTASLIGTPTVTLISSNIAVLPVFVAANITAISNIPDSLNSADVTSGGINITAPAAAVGTTVFWAASIISCEIKS